MRLFIATFVVFFIYGLNNLEASTICVGTDLTSADITPKSPHAQEKVARLLRGLPHSIRDRTEFAVFVVTRNRLPVSAAACIRKPEKPARVILIDEAVLDHPDPWTVDGMLAHEIGHHLRAHQDYTSQFLQQFNRAIDRVPGRRAELDADYVSGYLLKMAGATRFQATASLTESPSDGNHDYPPRHERWLSVIDGWQDAEEEEKIKPDQTAVNSVVEKFSIRDSSDIEGGDLGLKLINMSQDACAISCLQRNKCVGYSYNKWDSECFLKRTLRRTLLQPNSVVGVIKQLGLPAQQTFAPNYKPSRLKRPKLQFAVKDSRQKTEVIKDTFQDCLTDCEKPNSGCLAFTYIAATKSCSLFKTVDSYASNDGAESRYYYDDYSGNIDLIQTVEFREISDCVVKVRNHCDIASRTNLLGNKCFQAIENKCTPEQPFE